MATGHGHTQDGPGKVFNRKGRLMTAQSTDIFTPPPITTPRRSEPTFQSPSTGMIQPDEWELLVHHELVDKDLVSWITPVDPTSDGFECLEGLKPDVPRTDPSFKEWHRAYSKVSAAMTRNLGRDMMGIVRQQKYVALSSFCPALQRYRAIRSILERGSVFNSPLQDSLPNSTNVPGSHYALREPPDEPSNQAKKTQTGHDQNPVIPRLSPLRPNRIVLKPMGQYHRGGVAEQAAKEPTVEARTHNTPSQPISSPSQSTPMEATSRKRGSRAELLALRDERVVKHEWGQRCCTCGQMGITGPNSHATHACSATHLKATCVLPVSTRLTQKPKPALVVVGNHPEHHGKHLCYRWQFERTLDGLCYIPDCDLIHMCSLCLQDDHRAIDCDTHQYLPLETAPRPASLPPKDVYECHRHFQTLSGGLDIQSSFPSSNTAQATE